MSRYCPLIVTTGPSLLTEIGVKIPETTISPLFVDCHRRLFSRLCATQFSADVRPSSLRSGPA